MPLPIFPKDIAIKFGSTKSMKWDTKVQRSGSNKVRTLTNYLYPRWTIKVKATNLTDEDARRLEGFFMTTRGATLPFLWFDHEDHLERGAILGNSAMPGEKVYLTRSIGDFKEPILDIDEESLIVYVDGTPLIKDKDYTLEENGCISFVLRTGGTPTNKRLGRVTADFIYYWRVMLVKDSFTITQKFTNFNETGNFTMEVVR